MQDGKVIYTAEADIVKYLELEDGFIVLIDWALHETGNMMRINRGGQVIWKSEPVPVARLSPLAGSYYGWCNLENKKIFGFKLKTKILIGITSGGYGLQIDLDTGKFIRYYDYYK